VGTFAGQNILVLEFCLSFLSAVLLSFGRFIFRVGAAAGGPNDRMVTSN
jgi:hypothetical protein